MTKNKSLFLLSCMAVFAAGCVAKTDRPVPVKKSTAELKQPVNKAGSSTGINAELDFKRAIQTAVRNMVQSGALDNPAGDHYVVAVSSIVDVTKKGFNTKDIKQRLESELASGRKVRRVVSLASKTVSPQIIIAGRITQRTASVRGGRKRQEYYLHLVLTEAKSGMKLWENTTPVVKKATQKKYSQ